ncbi:MAG: hypothetical protein HY749_09995 [Gammaproteobacteria bacterium]|nr:hypothetical protein [Gammaproteobacteria bacterium]
MLTIGAAIGIIGQANITDADRKLDWGGYVDGRNTAGIWLGMLPAGMTVASASGHDYRVDPRAVSAVPLPAALWRAAGAPGGLGFARRRGGPP